MSTYTIVAIPTVLGASGGVFSASPASINALGQVVGGFTDCLSINMSECDHGPFSAVLYDPAKGTAERISIADAQDHTARAINDAGAILLNGNPWGTYDGFLLSNAVVTHFGEDAVVSGINSNGWVSGTNIWPDGRQTAFLWDGSTMSRVGPATSIGGGLNDAGIVVGQVLVGGYDRAAVFSGGAVQDLGILPGGRDSRAVAINQSGRIVGISSDELSPENGFVFDLPAGPMREVIPHGITVLAGVNAVGDAVGSILSFYLYPTRAILWHEGEVIDLTRALNDTSWLLLSATAINDKGQIVGLGLRDGTGFGYILTPK